jgi:hypothetical protein
MPAIPGKRPYVTRSVECLHARTSRLLGRALTIRVVHLKQLPRSSLVATSRSFAQRTLQMR